MPRQHRGFFDAMVGQTYRAPMFLATSFGEDVARNFMERLDLPSSEQQPPFQEPVLFVFHFRHDLPENRRCVHVNFIYRDYNSLGGAQEFEFLFAPYSAFTVRSVSWEAAPVVNNYVYQPHRIELDVAPDNLPPDVPLGLPLAPWC